MRPIGFSTGALVGGEFQRGIEMLIAAGVDTVEISALRLHELPRLIAALDTIPVERFRHVSVHAPSAFPPREEASVVTQLGMVTGRGWSIVVHPDVIGSPDLWAGFGRLLLVENMGDRKNVGKTAAEMAGVFEVLPDAGFCFDIAHARQVGPGMIEARRMLKHFPSRLAQVHISVVSASGQHSSISIASVKDYESVAHLIPQEVPIILESPVGSHLIAEEIAIARVALATGADED